jgi:simple sugar transport system ATP-binding protein
VTQGREAPLVALRGITKHYGDLLANDGVDLSLRPGEVHALLGENGAGKSTLVKILYGVIEPTAGEILWEGRPVRIGSPVEARRLGIGMVFQHFSLFDQLTVAENIAVALSGTLKEVRGRLDAVSRGYGLDLEPDRAVWTLSAGERQRIEIVRCLLQDPKLIVLDEPTSVLTPQETERLFTTLERLSAEGRAILYISHKLEEVRRLCRTATVLRAGRVVGTLNPRERSAREIAALMVGAEVGTVRPHDPSASGEEALAVRGLNLPALNPHDWTLKSIDLSVRKGEVLGIAGIAGNGQSELFAALSGERLSQTPEVIAIGGRPCGRLGIDARRRLGAAFVPEERLGHAAVPTHRLSENAVLSHHAIGDVARGGIVALGPARRRAHKIAGVFDVRMPSSDPQARQLSGGNLQKFVVGREVVRRPGILVVDQPTWGVDTGAARLIRQALVDLAREGAGILVVSQDLDELFEIADRIAVIRGGALSPARPAADWTRDGIGLEMMGVEAAHAA